MKYFLWGVIDPSGDDGRISAMVSRKNPCEQLSLNIKDWRILLKEFPRGEGRRVLRYAKRVLIRYHRIFGEEK